MKNTLGDRIKAQYENRTRYYLPRRTYTILRLDQKAAHTYTKNLNRPFDVEYMEDLDFATIKLLEEIQGAKFAYIQSDEVSVLLTDIENIKTSAWFDGNIQKISSVAASILTAEFNKLRYRRLMFNSSTISAYFDCRAFTIPDRIEVMNYFRFRQQDCIRNSVSMVAQSHFLHKELMRKSQSDMHEMLHTKDINWAIQFTNSQKNGRMILKETYEDQLTGTMRKRWASFGAWVFSKDGGKLLEYIPEHKY